MLRQLKLLGCLGDCAKRIGAFIHPGELLDDA
jgi:hypothetical protein